MALAVAVNANGYDYHPHYQHQVVEVAKVHSPVGSHGPALVNIFGPNKNYDYSWGGSSGGSNDGGYGGVQSGLLTTIYKWNNVPNSNSNKIEEKNQIDLCHLKSGWFIHFINIGGYGGYGSVGYSGDADHGHDG